MTILDEIIAHKRDEVAAQKTRRPLDEVVAAARDVDAPRSLACSLRVDDGTFRVIAEVKKASPSKGLIRPDFDPVAIARSYEQGGAAGISILTDEKYFQGRLEFLEAIRAAVDLPLLRKDFMVDPYQVWEARAAGADAILVILAALSDDEIEPLAAAAADLGLDILWEVHDAAEMERVAGFSPEIVGINNRNLRTFEVSLRTTRDLIPAVPEGALTVSESGFFERTELAMMREWGARAFMIGESLMRAPDPGVALAGLVRG